MTWTPDDQEMAELRNWLVDQGFVVLPSTAE
jgi:thiazole synthase ThiGH ThiG subunit